MFAVGTAEHQLSFKKRQLKKKKKEHTHTHIHTVDVKCLPPYSPPIINNSPASTFELITVHQWPIWAGSCQMKAARSFLSAVEAAERSDSKWRLKPLKWTESTSNNHTPLTHTHKQEVPSLSFSLSHTHTHTHTHTHLMSSFAASQNTHK